MFKTILLLLVISFSNSLFAQGNSTAVQPVKFAVFIIDGFSTKQEAHLINAELKTSPGVQMSRVDVPTQRCYVIFDPTTPYDENWFSTKVSQLGNFSVHCYYDGIHGEVDFIPLTQNDCPELN